MWNRKVFVRIIEMLLCISCVVALRVTDDESRRVFHYLRNRSREWSLLNNVTWGTIGSALATATCGGYLIVTVGLLIAAATDEFRGRKTEIFFLALGVVLFGIVGALALASIDSVPEDLVDNAAVLGALCLVTALVFVVDILMKIPGKKKKKKKHDDGTQTSRESDIANASVSADQTNNEEVSHNTNENRSGGKVSNTNDNKGSVNGAFEQLEPSSMTAMSRKNRVEEERQQRFEEVGRQLRESSRFKDKYHLGREYLENDNNNRSVNSGHSYGQSYQRNEDAYRRPADEIDTPLFPADYDNHSEPIFAKIINPGVKIMRVERDFGYNGDEYRYSDSSQYDNVPTRMRTTSPGILKKNRDVSFDIPPSGRHVRANGKDRVIRDDIERLEECFNVLQSTGTQTANDRYIASPSSPTDPGYVRHTANNWPTDFKSKTPGSSPEHETGV